jgi:thiol-disulfide isomerase/thioredoxin
MFFVALLFMLIQGPQLEDTGSPQYQFLYFFNPDCPNCKEIAPFMEYLREEYDARIYAYNTRNPVGFRYGMQHEIRYVPTLLIIIEEGDEKIVNRYEGSKEILEAEALIATLTANKSAPHRQD